MSARRPASARSIGTACSPPGDLTHLPQQQRDRLPAPGRGAGDRARPGRDPAGNRFQVSARCFVLACGGIENARLLLCSKRAADGLPTCPIRSGGSSWSIPTSTSAGSRRAGTGTRELYLDDNPVHRRRRHEGQLPSRLPPRGRGAASIADVAFQIRPRLPSLGEKSLQAHPGRAPAGALSGRSRRIICCSVLPISARSAG